MRRKIKKLAYTMVSNKSIKFNIDRLENKKSKMVDYLTMKVQEEDWHGVADAAMDIRDIESELIPYRSLK